MKAIDCTYRQPRLSYRIVWAGAWGGHYDAIVFFKHKPKKTEYTTIENKTVGCMYLCDFKELYPDADISELLDSRGRPLEIEVTNFVKLRLQAFWNEYGELFQYKTRAEGY